MRWVKALIAFALVAAACSPFVPAETPSPSPTAIARGTPRPAFTPRPPATVTPRTTPRPSATTVSRASAGPVPTPQPTVARSVINTACSEWPADVEILTVMTYLPLPPSLCLLRASPAFVGQTVCTVVGCVPVTAACADEGSCIQVIGSEHPHYVLVWFGTQAARPGAQPEGYTMTRHLCRLHQERSRIDAILRGRATPGWPATVEGVEFGTAFASFRAGYPEASRDWGVKPVDEDNYVDVCSAWYYPAARDLRVGGYLPLVQFAQKWLPRP